MTTRGEAERLITTLDDTVAEAFAYFEGPGATSKVKVGEWGPREVLCHFIFWHDVSIEGMESVTRGGQPRLLDASADELNARTVARRAGETIQQLIADGRRAHRRLVEAASKFPNLDTVVVRRDDGSTATVRQRLEVINEHWQEHLRELRR